MVPSKVVSTFNLLKLVELVAKKAYSFSFLYVVGEMCKQRFTGQVTSGTFYI